MGIRVTGMSKQFDGEYKRDLKYTSHVRFVKQSDEDKSIKQVKHGFWEASSTSEGKKFKWNFPNGGRFNRDFPCGNWTTGEEDQNGVTNLSYPASKRRRSKRKMKRRRLYSPDTFRPFHALAEEVLSLQ